MVSRDSVWIALKIAALNDLDVLACDIQNTYLTADFRNWLWVVSSDALGSEAGNDMLAQNSLYVLKRSGAAFRAFVAETMDKMGYRPS